MMKKILFCCMNYRPEIISTGKYAYELCEYLASNNWEVEVITTAPHYPGWKTFLGYSSQKYVVEKINGVTVRRAPMYLHPSASGLVRLFMPLTWALSSLPVVLARAIMWRPDVILCVQPTLFMAPAALAAAAISRAGAVQHVQDVEIDTALAMGHLRAGGWVMRLIFAIERWTMRRFDHVVTISEKMRAVLVSKGVAADQISVIRNWVDTQVVRPLGRPSSYRADLGIDSDTFIVQYAGQMGRKQALHVVMEAARLLANDPRFVFALAGDGPVRADIEREAEVLPNVRLLPLQPTEMLGEFLNLADCHILPQEADVSDLVLPSKLGGMLASGKRLLVTADDQSELGQFLGDAAILTPPGDAGAIVQALKSMIGQVDTQQQLRLARARDLESGTLLAEFAHTLRSA